MPIILHQTVTTHDIDINDRVRYVFVENDKKQGGSQGAKHLRDHERGIGLRIKRAHGDEVGSYWSDDEFDLNRNKVKEDIGKLEQFLKEGGTAVLIKGDLDSYRESRFLEICPRSYKFFRNSLAKCIKIYRP
jgi:hypothetical protein|tara:strand:+ start:2586 stop:2981 length:396 start_codon:yes stop_codon:yes gene_type:complete